MFAAQRDIFENTEIPIVDSGTDHDVALGVRRADQPQKIAQGQVPNRRGERAMRRRKPLEMPDFRSSAVEVKKPGATLAGNVPTLGNFLREVMRRNMDRFRVFGPDETQSNRLEQFMRSPRRSGSEHTFLRTPTAVSLLQMAA